MYISEPRVTQEKKEASAEGGFIKAAKGQKSQKVVNRERLNTQKKLPEFMLKETDPIKRMKYKTGACFSYRYQFGNRVRRAKRLLQCSYMLAI